MEDFFITSDLHAIFIRQLIYHVSYSIICYSVHAYLPVGVGRHVYTLCIFLIGKAAEYGNMLYLAAHHLNLFSTKP